MSAVKPVKIVLEEGDISRALTRIAHEIIEKNRGSENLLLLGIPTRGAYLAARLAKIIGSIDQREIANGVLDITLHRDDLRSKPPRALTPTVIPAGGVENMIVVLVDDVLFRVEQSEQHLMPLVKLAVQHRCNLRCWLIADTVNFRFEQIM